MEKTYTISELQKALLNLDNAISCEPQETVKKNKRVKLPVPEEYGGGTVTGFGYEEAVRNLIKRLKAEITTTSAAPYFKDCWEKWISIKMGQNRSASTIESYKALAKKHILPFFGEKRIDEITPDDIQEFYNSMMKLSASVSNQSKAILCGIFDRSARLGEIDRNIMLYKYDRSKKKGDKVVLQDCDLVDVISQLDKLSGQDYLYFCFLCFTALRRGEILGLKWSDIDFDKQEIHVHNNVTFPNGANDPVLTQPKDGSFGKVHLSSELANRIVNYRSTGYVLSKTASDGKEPITKSMFMKMWYRIKKTVDLKGATSHSFRATYATMMNAHCEHVDPKVLQGALRHKTPDLAIKVYTKENEDKTRKAEVEYDKWLNSQLKQSSLRR